MLFLLFQLGQDRFALQANRVVEVVPLLELKQLPHAPKGLAGIFNYRGRPVPAVDLCELTQGRPARELLSTRIIVTNCADAQGTHHLLGLIAEQATETLRREPKDFLESGVSIEAAPYLGPVLMDPKGAIQLVYEDRLLSQAVRELLFTAPAQLAT
jgi:chemotaxis-related protein WspB